MRLGADHLSGQNQLSKLLDAKRAAGARVRDLTVSNPTAAGIVYPAQEILAALADPRALVYEPAPRGLPSARAAIAARYGVSADQVLLTASTSEAYSYLFKYLCDPGDGVLAPEPSYPLFAHLAALDGVDLASYPLAYDGEWHIDFAGLAVTPRTRAILLVNPNNPTGSYLKEHELRRLEGLGLPLISDEVFADYPAFEDAGRVTFVAGKSQLGFSLGGLSKSCGLPQLKLGWIVSRDSRALEVLELIADAYLSVATPVQHALPRLLELGDQIRAQIAERVRANRAWLAGQPLEVLPAEGGWTAIIRLPSTRTDEEVALALLRDHDVLVHPGYFFDFPRGTYLVVSLLTPRADLEAGVKALAGATLP